MQLVHNNTNSNSNNIPNKDVIRIILDESRIYIKNSLDPVMVRGEVVVNFPKDTYIQGPIELLFENIQRFYPWEDIMINTPIGQPIETKLQVTELSLLPPNSQGIMPSGIQRFPFEFPIPATIPSTVFIKDRIEIFCQLSATIRRSSLANSSQHKQDYKNITNLINWGRYKNKYVACTPIRIVRTMESILSGNLYPHRQPQESIPPPSPLISSNSSIQSDNSNTSSTATISPWNRRILDSYQYTYDEQHDLLAISLAGRSIGNLSLPAQDLHQIEGIRYKIGIDRTVIALGTKVGIEVMVEPIYDDVIVKSVLLKISEDKRYTMKIPAGYTWGINFPEIRKYIEKKKMVLKWAHGYQIEDHTSGEYIKSKKEAFVRPRTEDSQYFSYLDSHPSYLNSKSTFSCKMTEDIKMPSIHHNSNKIVQDDQQEDELISLKEIDQPVRVGEYFGGRFVMPFPNCSNILHPSMKYESISINHWFHLIVTVECNGRTLDLTLDTPGHILDCRLVNDDECQTLLPPPPSYQASNEQNRSSWNQSTFWEQREAITLESGWGSVVPCPCKSKRLKAKNKDNNPPNSNKNVNRLSNNTTELYPSSYLSEWGPPPCYSKD